MVGAGVVGGSICLENKHITFTVRENYHIAFCDQFDVSNVLIFYTP